VPVAVPLKGDLDEAVDQSHLEVALIPGQRAQ